MAKNEAAAGATATAVEKPKSMVVRAMLRPGEIGTYGEKQEVTVVQPGQKFVLTDERHFSDYHRTSGKQGWMSWVSRPAACNPAGGPCRCKPWVVPEGRGDEERKVPVARPEDLED